MKTTGNILHSVYSNKLFKFLFAFVFIMFLIVKRDDGNLDDFFKKSAKNIESIKENVVETKDKITDIRKNKEIEANHINKPISKEAKEKERKINEMELLRKEIISEFFTNTDVSHNKKIKNGDNVTVKFIIFTGEQNFITLNPATIKLLANQKGDLLSKTIVGKRVGEIFNVRMADLVNISEFRKNLDKTKNEVNVDKDTERRLINVMNSAKTSDMVYKIKIIDIDK